MLSNKILENIIILMILVHVEMYYVCKVHAKMLSTLQGKSWKYSIVNTIQGNFGVPLSTQEKVSKIMKILLKRWGQSVILDLSRNDVIDTMLADMSVLYSVQWSTCILVAECSSMHSGMCVLVDMPYPPLSFHQHTLYPY